MNIPMIKLPTYELILPSTKETIVFRPYTVREEKILVLAMQSENSNDIKRAMTDIVKNCTFDKIDINSHPMFDIQYVFLKLRCKSVGELSDVIISCGSCDHSKNHIINLEEIKVSNLDTETILPYNILDFSEFKLEMKYPQLADLEILQKFESEEDIFKLVVSCVTRIYDEEQEIINTEETRNIIIETLENMTPERFVLIQNFFKNMPSLHHTIEFTCDECGSENKIDISGIYNFFL